MENVEVLDVFDTHLALARPEYRGVLDL